MNITLSFGALMITITLFFGCNNTDKSAKETSEVRTLVSIVHPSFQNITEFIQLNGITMFQKKDNIRSTTTGYISSLKFNQGDYIKTGSIFCSIRTKEQEALKYISTHDSSINKFQYPLPVYSNASGIITTISTLQGDYVSEGDVMANVSEPNSLIVQVNVPYEYNQLARAGKSCEIVLPDGKSIRATISGEMPTVNATSQSQTFFIRLPNQSLPENLNVTIRIPTRNKNNLLCVSTETIQTDELQKQFWVMKCVNDSLAIKINIQIGLQNDSFTEIISDDISITDKIIFHGAFGLVDSSLVISDKQ